jgi:hypothetical protein
VNTIACFIATPCLRSTSAVWRPAAQRAAKSMLTLHPRVLHFAKADVPVSDVAVSEIVFNYAWPTLAWAAHSHFH